jgi:hypothetical protein
MSVQDTDASLPWGRIIQLTSELRSVAEKWAACDLPPHITAAMDLCKTSNTLSWDGICEPVIDWESQPVRFKGWDAAATMATAPRPEQVSSWMWARLLVNEATELANARDVAGAWSAVVEAMWPRFFAEWAQASPAEVARLASGFGRRAADARHEAARRNKAALLTWYGRNGTRYKSHNAAAAAAAKRFNVAPETARDYIREYRGKLGSARTP